MAPPRTLEDNVPVPLYELNSLRLPNTHTPSSPNRHLRLVTSGETGEHGPKGRNGLFGGSGGQGLPGSRGSDAAAIKLSLSLRNNIIIARHKIAAKSSIDSPLNLSDPMAAVFLEAMGGDGGRGGDGGHGGDGMPGSPGHNATRYSSATAGGPGQDGGPGGDGGDGGDGGNGAGIIVTVREADMDLLVLVKTRPSAVGGKGGVGGTGGSGGDGGRGGRGGNGYSWTEYHTVYVNGRSETRSVYRSNPGAPNGISGSPGRNGANGVAGNAGKDGVVRFCVDRLGQYEWRYDLRVAGTVTVEDELGVGVLQPGARVLMDYAVENCGKMPTPTAQDVLMSIENGRWASPLQARDQRGSGSVVLPRAIPMAHRMPLPEPLNVMLNDIVAPVVGDPFITRTDLRHRAVVSRINQTMPLVSDQATVISMTFPLHMSHLFGNVCVLSGAEAFIAWRVTNISRMNIGSEAPLQRVAHVRFLAVQKKDRDVMDDRGCTISSAMSQMGHEMQSELSPTDFAIGPCNPVNGEMICEYSSPGVTLELNLIETGADALFVCGVRVMSSGQDSQEDIGLKEPARSAKHHSQACLTSYLDLGRPQSLLQLQPIQVRPFQVQLAEQFSFHSGEAKVLLVVNNRTNPSEIGQWRYLIAALMNTSSEHGVALWNISLYGGFSFKYKVSVSGQAADLEEKRPLGSLFSAEDSLVVVLNNSCTPMALRADTSEYFPMEVMKRHDILHACKNYKCNVYIAGSSTGAELRSRVRIPVDAEKLVEFEDTDMLLRNAISTLHPDCSQIDNSQRSTGAMAQPAWMTSDLKGPLYKYKRSGRGKVRRIFCLRKERGELLYYKKSNSKRPSGNFQLSELSVVTLEPEETVDPRSDNEREVLVLQTPDRQLKLQSVTSKGSVLGPSLAEWNAEIMDGITSKRMTISKTVDDLDVSLDAVENLDLNSLRETPLENPDFDGAIPKGFDRYCEVKIITRQINVQERMLRKKAEEFAQTLAGRYPEYPFLVVYKYVEKREQDHNRGVMFNKRNIGELFVHLGLPRGRGQVVGKCSDPNEDKARSNRFVHRKVLSERNKYGILKSLPIAMKLRFLRDAGQDGILQGGAHKKYSFPLHLLIDAILSDAVDEHAVFRFGSVSTASKIKQTLMPSKKRGQAEDWAMRMACLVAISNEGAIGAVTTGSEKFKEVFRLCATLRMAVVKSSVPKMQRMLKVSRPGLIARAGDLLLRKLERSFAAALGLQNATEIRNEAGHTVEQSADHLMKHGVTSGDRKANYSEILSFLRCRHDLGVEGADEEGGMFKPIVIPYQEYATAKKRDRRTPFPVISMTPGVFESTEARQEAISSLHRKWESFKAPIVRL